MMCNDIVLQSLYDYLDSTDGELTVDLLSDQEFEEVSVARWTAAEVAEAIVDHPFNDPEDILENFALKMMYFRANAEDRPSERIFAIAAETALEWLDIIKNEFSGGNST